MDSLSDVIECCRVLTSEKSADRKKALEKLKQLLNKKSVIGSLDQNSVGRARNALTWDDVLREVNAYIGIETQVLQRSKEAQTAVTKANREKRKQEIGAIYKYVVKLAEKRGPKLRATAVVRHILEVITDDYMQGSYGLDYSNVLLKNILTVRKYCTEMTDKLWHELITVYCRLYRDPDCILDRILLSRLIRTLITATDKRCDLRPKKLLVFFMEVFKDIRQEKRVAVMEHLVCAVNVFVRSISHNSRAQICKLGESLCINMLFLWQNKPTNTLKEEIINFLRIQVIAHHPSGSRRDQDGSYAYDWDEWQSLLRKMYEMFYSDLQQHRGRSRFSGGSKESCLPRNYIELVVDICNQLFEDNAEMIEVTQSSEQGPGAKKRRLESGWCYVLEFLTDQHANVTPWVQLVSRFVQKYPDMFPQNQILPYLEAISKQLSEFKRVDVIQHVIFCAKSFIESWKVFPDEICEKCSSVLKKICLSALRSISVHQAEDAAYQLLTSMTVQGMVIEPDMWNLFVLNVTRPSLHAVNFLLNYLMCNKIPENFRNHLTTLTAMFSESSRYPLRQQLLGWLLPRRSQHWEVSTGNIIQNHPDPEIIGHCLTLLLLKNQNQVPKCDFIDKDHECDSFYEDLQDTYLQLSDRFTLTKTKDEHAEKIKTNCELIFLSDLYKQVLTSLHEEGEYLSEIVECDMKHLEAVCHHICLTGSFFKFLVRYKLVKRQDVKNFQLSGSLKSLLKKLSNNVKLLTQSDSFSQPLRILRQLQKLLHPIEKDKIEDLWIVNATLRSLFPSNFINHCLQFITDKKKVSEGGDRSFRDGDRSGLHHHSVLDDFDDFDIEADDRDTQDTEENDFSEDFGDSQNSDDAKKEQDFKSVLDKGQLSEKHTIELEVTGMLALWCGYDKPEYCKVVTMDTDQGLVKSRLIKSMESLDSAKPLDLIQLRSIVKNLTEKFQHMSEDNLETLITVVRVVAKNQRQDQEVCCLCLELISDLIPYLRSDDNMVTEQISECRQSCLILLSAFWNLQVQDKCMRHMRLAMVRCMETFIQVDGEQNWTYLSLKGEDGTCDKCLVSREIVKYVGDLCHVVRMFCAKAIQRLFTCRGIPHDKSVQDKNFDMIYEEIMELLEIQGNLSAERAIDERNNRIASALTTVANIVCSSPVCEKKALFALCQLTKARNIETNRIQKVIERLAETLGYKNSHHYIQNYVPYLVHQWLCLKYTLQEFPHQVAFCPTAEKFYREYYETLITEVFMFKDVDAAKKIAVVLKKDWLDVLKTCIPKILVYILPLFAASGHREASSESKIKKRTKHATECYDMLHQQASKEVVDKCIVSNLDIIVVNILLCLYDPDEDEFMKTTVIRNLDPEPNPPCYSLYQTQSTLDYLTNSFSGNKPLVEVLSKSPDSIQKILLKISVRLFTEHRLHEKRRLLLMYRLICRLIMAEIHSQLGGNWAYTLREIIHRLIFITKDMIKRESIGNEEGYANNISCMALELLRDVLQRAVEVHPKELEKYFRFMVNSLVPMVNHSTSVTDQVLHILKILICDNKKTMKNGIRSLDPFPDKEMFISFSEVYREVTLSQEPLTLEKTIRHYLQREEIMSTSTEHCKEGLQYLSKQLHSMKGEITQIATSEGTDNVLCHLVMQLVKKTQMCPDFEVQKEITRCLGLIGPVDMVVMALPHSNIMEEDNKITLILKLLNQYLTDQNMMIVQATCKVLKAMLTTTAGVSFINEIKDQHQLLQYIHPFCPKKKTQYLNGELASGNYDQFVTKVNRDDLWWDTDLNHETWVSNLTSSLINCGAVTSSLLCHLEPVCLLKTEFCEFILPLLVHSVLEGNNDLYQEIISRQISKFFLHHCKLSENSTEERRHSICMNKDSVRTLLSVIHYLRQNARKQKGRKPMTVWDNNFWVDINYLHIAKAALFCSAHFSTILYAEIWCNCQRLRDEQTVIKNSSQLAESMSQSFTQDSQVDSMSSESDGITINVQEILLEAYRQIGDPDGVYGCGAGRLADPVSRVRTYEHEKQWGKAVITYDIEHQDTKDQDFDMLQALDKFGSRHLLNSYLLNTKLDGSPQLRDLQFKTAWNMGKWNMENIDSGSTSFGFNEALYNSLCSIKDQQFTVAASALDIARQNVIERLGKASMESCRCLYPVMSDLQCVTQIDQVISALTKGTDEMESLLTSWCDEGILNSNDFEYIEPAYHIRCSILKSLLHVDSTMSHCLQKHLIDLINLATQTDQHQIAERAIQELKCLETTDFNLQIQMSVEEAKLYWARGEHNIAKHLMKNLLKDLNRKQDYNAEAMKMYPRALGIYGNWLAETHSENRNVIMEEYLEKTVQLYNDLGEEGDTALDAYLALARFADGQYQQIINYMNSPTYEAKQNLMIKAKKEMAKMEQLPENEIKQDRYYTTLKRQSRIDQSELTSMQEDKDKFLMQAIQNYIKCLKLGDKHDIRLFRLVSLWFSNPTIPDVSGLIMVNYDSIKSYKFLSLMYQLCARMDTRPPADQTPCFQKVLKKIIHRTAVEHPHHTLFCIFALANAKEDRNVFKKATTTKRSLSKTSQGTAEEKNEGRIEAAKALIDDLQRDKSHVSSIVTNMQVLCDAYIQLANFNVSQYRNETKPIPLDQRLKIMQIKNLDNMALPTENIPIDPDGNYRRIVTLQKFQPTFKLAGGVNLPKIITCIGSDGREKRQLVKGRDDLRQDAIMQQVFGMLNTLLCKNPETRKRQLNVRQYKVIPLSQCSGVLEWCEGTLPIGAYLIGDKSEERGAHKRFRPQDNTAFASRKLMQEKVHSALKDKLKNFLQICSKFRPVMRYFFMENFSQPSVWFERRLAYTKSVSTTSIVGYILGLGDRHVQNILIDTKSAELVHIDLGIAFEQGRILPTPEMVPFRLTRDIIDGMGVSGAEGVFRRCCEKTMEVMHNNQEALLTILEVLLYDPLNNWTISPQKAAALQSKHADTEIAELNATRDILDITVPSFPPDETEESVNKLAERVLLRLRQKLQGFEDGVQLSISGQVNNLIQEARDPKNLCKMFAGWQPYI